MRPARALPAYCLALPGIVVALVFGVSGAASLVTGTPLVWPPPDLTLSEAVALRDRGEIVRQMMAGADPNRRYPTYGVFREGEEVALTPLEAAVITREPAMVSLVLGYGGVLTDQNTVTLQCLADDVGAPPIRSQLAEMTRGDVDCAGVALPWRLN